MHSAEWSLVFFTLLSQFSMGMLTSVFIFRVFLSADSPVNQEKLTIWCITTAFITMLVALVISFLHLNAPLSSIYAMSNLRESWLSREILMASVFAFLLFLQVAASGFKLVSARYQNVLMTVGLIAGLYLIYSMGRLYMIPTVPAWDHPGTMLAFYATAFLTGPAGLLTVQAKLNSKNEFPKNPPANLLVYGGMIFAGMLMVAAAAIFSRTETANMVNIGFDALSMSPIITISRWILLVTGVAAIMGTIGPLKKPHTTIITSKYFWGFVLIFISEILARIVFYNSYFRIGL